MSAEYASVSIEMQMFYRVKRRENICVQYLMVLRDRNITNTHFDDCSKM